MSVCAQTIYRACYANDARSGLPAGSWAKLPRRARRRRPRSVAQAQKPSPLGEYRRLADRRADVDDRAEPGHWDRDLIVGKANLTAAVTLAERTSRYTVTAACPTATARPKSPPRSPRLWAASLAGWCARSPGTKAARWPAGPTSKPRSASRCSSASRARRGSGQPTSTPTTCPADSTTGHQPPTSTLNSLATTGRACRRTIGGSHGSSVMRRRTHRTGGTGRGCRLDCLGRGFLRRQRIR